MQAFTQTYIFSLKRKDRAWDVRLVGEGASDIGGPFNESLTSFATDIQNELLVPCPNQREGVGYNQDKFVPKITHGKPLSGLDREMWRFVGKLIGVSIRVRQTLDLRLPSFFWKPLVGQEIDMNDVAQIDQTFAQQISTFTAEGTELIPSESI